jgi:hypothetical protein
LRGRLQTKDTYSHRETVDVSVVYCGTTIVVVAAPHVVAPSTCVVASASGDIVDIDVGTFDFDVVAFNVAATVTSVVVVVAPSNVADVVVPNVAPRESPVAFAVAIAIISCRRPPTDGTPI